MNILHLGICDSLDELKKQGRSIKASVKPLGSEVAVYPTGKVQQLFPQDQRITFAQLYSIPSSRVSFIQDCLFVQRKDWTKAAFDIEKIIYEHVRCLQSLNEEEEGALFSAIHSIWQLSRTLWFSKDVLPTQLSNWLSTNHSEGLSAEFDACHSKSPTFWPFVFKCIIRGHYKAASALLGSLTSYKFNQLQFAKDSNPVACLIYLMENIPTRTMDLIRWKEQVSLYYEQGQMSSFSIDDEDFDYFGKAFKILLGDEDVIVEFSTIWQEAIVGLVSFAYPTIQAKNVASLLETISTKFQPTTILDKILWAVFEMDVSQLIKLTSGFDWWLVTHLVEFLNAFDLLKDLEHLVPWYKMAFAEYLSSDPKLWRLTCIYLESNNPELIPTVLSHIPLDNYMTTIKMLAYCKTHKLDQVLYGLYRILAQQALDHNAYAEALYYLIEAKEMDRVDHLVQEILNKDWSSIIQSVNPSLLYNSPRLAFLQKYYEFKNCQEPTEAGKLLVAILTSGAAPKSFLSNLILDAKPLLEKGVFDQSECYEIERCMEECILHHAAETYRPVPHKPCQITSTIPSIDSTTLLNLRLELSRNLAKSF